MASEMTAAEVAHRNTISWIINYHDSTNLGASARNVERNSGLFFNLKYFEDCFIKGDLDEADYYLSGFTSVNENEFSTGLFFEIRWHKFLQALDLKQRQRARKILREELRPYECSHDFKDKAFKLLGKQSDFRDELQTEYKDIKLARLRAVNDVIRNNLEANPSLKGKIVYPPPSQPLAVVLPPPHANQADQSLAPIRETRGVTIQPLPAPQPPPTAPSLQPSGVIIRREHEEEMEHGNNSRHCLDLVPVNVHAGNLGSTSSEAPKRKPGRPPGRRNNSRMDSRAVPEILGTTAEAPKRKRGRPGRNNSNMNSRTDSSATPINF